MPPPPMELELPATVGLLIRGSAHARPSEVAPGRAPGRLSNSKAFEALLGPDWKAELGRRDFPWAMPRNEWGIAAREWSVVPGSGAPPACSALELGVSAGRAALADAGWAPDEVDLVVGASVSVPSELEERVRLGRALAEELGASRAQTGPIEFDTTGGLLPWLRAVERARSAEGQRPRRILVVGADTLSTRLDPSTLEAALTFGDAGAALALEWCEVEAAGLAGGGSGLVPDQGPAFAPPAVRGNWTEVEAAAWSRAVEGIANLPSAAALVPYGLSALQVARVAELAGYKSGRVKSSLADHGSVGAASILLTMHELLRDSARAGADLNVFHIDLVGAGADGRWAWMRWNLGDEREPEAALVDTGDA